MFKRSFVILLVVIAAFWCGRADAGINGTANGTYDFSNGDTPSNGGIGADNSAGAGFATFSDKFVLSNGMLIDDLVLTSIWTGNQQTAGTTGSFTVKAEGGSTCKSFTFKDLAIHDYDGSTNLNSITVTTKRADGSTIATHASGVISFNSTTPTQLSTLINSGNQFNDTLVASIEISWTFQGGSAPSNLNFDNITIANVSAVPAPTVTGISPTSGTTAGGTSVTITGTGFVNGATVTIGGASATGVTWSDATSISATTPAGTAGARDVVVTNPDTQTGTLAGGFTYVAAPTVTTQAVSSIAATSATGNGTITATGGANATTRGAIYYAYTDTDKQIGDAGVTNVSENGTFGTGAFTASLTSLAVNTRYNARAYATNTGGTGYGARVAFWTLANVPSAPTVNNPTTSTLDVAINVNGNPAATEFAIQETGTGNYVQADGTLGAGAVWQNAATWGTRTVTGLSAGSTYTFQVKARNGGSTETAYGSTASGTPVGAPTVTTQAASDLAATSATGNGTITATNGANATTRGVIYYAYTNTDKQIGDAGVTDVSENGTFGTSAFTASLTSLSVNTRYNARAYAISPNGTGYGARVAFWTLANVPSAPTVNNPTATALDVAINVNGNPAATEFAIQETGTGNYVQADGTLGAGAVWQNAATWGTKTVTGLTTGSTYTFQVKARNGGSTETAFGATASGTPVAAPTVTTQAASSVAATTATGNGTITATNGANATTRGVIYYTYTDTDKQIGDAGVTNISENGTFGTGAFTASLTSLSVNTRYNARAYAISPNGTGYGARVAFWTLANVPSAPTVNNPTATTLDVAVNVNSNPASTEFAIQETSTTNYVQADGTLGVAAVWQNAATWGTRTVTGLTTGSTYTFQVKARNGGSTETAFGATASGVPVAAPTVTTQAASSVAATTATGNGTITATNGANAITRGVIYYAYTNTDKIVGDAGVTNVSENGTFGTGAFTASLTSLSVNTQYNARAYATSPNGTGYGARVAFWTLANVPSAPTVNNATLTTLDVIVNVNSNPAATEFAIQETSTGNYVQADGTLGAGAVWQNAATWGTRTVTGLTTASTYTFQVKARNGGSTETAFGATASGTPVAAPSVTTGSASSISVTGATLGGTVTSNGASTTVTFEYGTTTGYGTSVSAAESPLAMGAVGTGVSAAIGGLTCNTTYHFRVKGVNSEGTTNGNDASFSTSACTSQTITFTNPGVQVMGTNPNLTATATSSLAVSFSSATTGVCTITAGGALTLVTPGVCTIAADQAGNATYGAAPQVIRSFTVAATANKVHLTHNSTTTDYHTIQSAVDAAADGDTINIDAGTFVEQVTVTKAITIQGAGKTATFVKAPLNASLVASSQNTIHNKKRLPILDLRTATPGTGTITVRNLGIDGDLQGHTQAQDATNDNWLLGIASFDTNAVIDNIDIQRIAAPLEGGGTYEGLSRHDGILAEGSSALAAPVTVTIQNSTIGTFQKAGILAWGPKLNAVITNNHVSGVGILGKSGQSGIQIGSSAPRNGATATISGNTIDLLGAPDSLIGYGATGILHVYAGTVEAANNTITLDPDASAGKLVGIDVGYSSSVATLHDNTLNDMSIGILVDSPLTAALHQISNNTLSTTGGEPVLFQYNPPGDASETTIANFGPGYAIQVVGENFSSGTLTTGTGTGLSANSVQAAVSGGSTTLYMDTTTAGGTLPLPVILNGTYLLGNFALSGEYIRFTKINQTISFADPGSQTYGTSPTLTATSDSGLAVSFTSSTTGVCTITSGGALTFVTAGPCTINADQAGNGNYNAAAQVSRTFTVNKAAATVTLGSLSQTYDGTAKTATATTNPTGKTVTFTYDGSATAPTNAGSYTVVGTVSDANYQGSATGTLVIAKAGQTITFTDPGTQTYGTTPTLTATATSGLAISFTSSTTGVCTITSGGALTFVTTGPCIINADQAGNGNYNAAAQVSRTFTVNKAAATVTFGSLSQTYDGTTKTVTATTNPTGKTVTFTYDGSATAPTNAGSYTVVGTISDANYQGSATGTLVIAKAGQTITFNDPGTQTYGTSPTLTATATSGLAVSFTSGTTGVCTITSGGALTFVTAGNCTINSNQAGDGNYNAAAQVSRTFTVNKAAATVTLGSLSHTYDGTAKTATATTTPTGLTVMFTYDGSATAPTNAGSYTVVGTISDANYQGSASGTLTIGKAAQSIAFGTAPAIVYGGTGTISATATSGLTVTFTSTTPTVCTVSGATVTAVAVGTCTTAADQAGNGNYSAASQATQSFAIGKASQTITFGTAPAVFVGTTGTVSATATSGLAVSFTSTTPLVCSVSGTTVTGTFPGTCTIAANQSGNGNFNAATPATQSMTVVVPLSLFVSTLSDGAVTTETTVNVCGLVTNPAFLSSLTINGVAVQVSAFGLFSYPVQLLAGANTITVVATSTAGDVITDSRTITLDTSAPHLTISYPPDLKSVMQQFMTVTGSISNLFNGTAKVAPAATGGTVSVTYTVNGSAPQIAAVTDNIYSFDVNLDQGMNTIQVSATDTTGNTAQAKRTVSYAPGFSLAVTDPASDIRTVTDSYLLTGTVAENTTPVTVTVTMDGQTYTPTVVDGAFQQELPLADAKVYQISVTGTDQNSNTSTVQRNIIRTVPLANGTAPAFSIVDALLALQMSVGLVQPQTDQILRMDVAPMVNGVSVGDGAVNLEDAVVILRMVVGLI